jgi:hypothetical protein
MAQGPAYSSNYPTRFTYGVTIGGTPVVTSQPGNVYWVNNSSVLPPGGVAGVDAPWPTSGTYLRPFASIDYAVGQCVAGRGDIINVMPSHVEAVATAAGIDFDVDAITVNGIGVGLDQPKVTFTATTSTVEINADGVTINGLNFEATVSAVAVGIAVLDGADDFRILNNRFTCETLTTDEFLAAVNVTTSDRGIIAGNYFDMDEAGAATAIKFIGVCLGGQVLDNYITGDYSTACINSITTAQEQLVIAGNTLINGAHSGLNTVACIVLLTGTTAVIQNNQLYTNVSGAATGAIVADAAFIGGDNWISTSASSAPIAAEGGASGIIRSSVCTGKADETDGLGLFTVTGQIYVHGITQRAEVAANSAVEIGIQVDATDTTLDAVLVVDTNLSTETAVGDYAVSTAIGGSFSVVQVETTTTSVMWNTPVTVPAGIIEQAAGGAAGTLVSGYIVYWSEATPGATCVAI